MIGAPLVVPLRVLFERPSLFVYIFRVSIFLFCLLIFKSKLKFNNNKKKKD